MAEVVKWRSIQKAAAHADCGKNHHMQLLGVTVLSAAAEKRDAPSRVTVRLLRAVTPRNNQRPAAAEKRDEVPAAAEKRVEVP